MNTALVVIDMQPDFYAANSIALQYRVLKAIKHAKKNGWHIINVLYEDFGEVAGALQKPLRNAISVWKDNYDGGTYIADVLHVEKIKPDRFVLCGVNATCCVASTAWGLSQEFPDAEILISKAVGDDDVYHPENTDRPRVLVGCNKMAVADARGSRYDDPTTNIKASPLFGP